MGCSQSTAGSGGGPGSGSGSVRATGNDELNGNGKKNMSRSRKGIGHTERMGTRSRMERFRRGGGGNRSSEGIGRSARLPRNGGMGAKGPKGNGLGGDDGNPPPPDLDEDGKLTPESVELRIEKSARVCEIVLKGGGGNNKMNARDREGKDEGLVVVHGEDLWTKIKYAYITQRGYYPDDVHKANQDKFSISTNFAGIEGDALFAVYDGHGRYGHDCAQFAKDRYPKILEKHVRQERIKRHKANLAKSGRSNEKGSFNPKFWPMLTAAQYEGAIRGAHAECNRAMHNDDKVDDTLSGTTIVACAFHNGRMIVSNAGDSRAVLGYSVEKTAALAANDGGKGREEEEKEELPYEPSPALELDAEKATREAELDDVYREMMRANEEEGEGQLVALPLTRDHTPFRTDERERIKKAGGRILTVDMLEGLEPVHENFGEFKLGEDIDEIGDPPRVWMVDADFPGTAFTRSLGDTVAEDIGVTSDPEIVSREVTSNDRILVVASDGVFEFLPNQVVIDICADCFDPLEACKKLAEESYKKWLHYELRTDDITAIVLFLQCPKEASDQSADIRQMLEISTAEGQKPIKSSLKASPQDKPESTSVSIDVKAPLPSLDEEPSIHAEAAIANKTVDGLVA